MIDIERECERCGQLKPDVTDGFDPFAAEINDEDIPVTWCEDCYREQADEI